MKESRYTVGQVSKITGVPKDTLLFYDKIDLFKPKYVDAKTKYRYYTYEQFWILDIIICCRNLNIPLATIKDILKAEDNKKIVALMKEHQKYAEAMSKYFAKVSENIDWYSEQYELVENANASTEVTVKYFSKRKVIYAENKENIREYHVKWMEAARSVLKQPDSFRRFSGFIMDEEGLTKNKFMKIGEYVEFETEIPSGFDENYCRVLPEGEYACCVVHVVKREVDFSIIRQWLEKNNIRPELILVEEIGFQLYEYFGKGYPCIVRVKI